MFVKLKYHAEPYSEWHSIFHENTLGFDSYIHIDCSSTAEISEQYSKTQPLDQRKLGFGSHDATKSGEFTCYKATERYRSVVKQENKLRELHRNASNEKDILSIKTPPPLPPKDKSGKTLEVPKFTFDVGRTFVTPYNPNTSEFLPLWSSAISYHEVNAHLFYTAHDSFYSIPKHAKVDAKLKGKDDIRRLGSHRPTSSTIGEYAWSYNYSKPEHCRRSHDGFDHGHLECSGF